MMMKRGASELEATEGLTVGWNLKQTKYDLNENDKDKPTQTHWHFIIEFSLKIQTDDELNWLTTTRMLTVLYTRQPKQQKWNEKKNKIYMK